MDSSFWIDSLRLGAVILLVLANGFFVAAEFSLVSMRRTRVIELVTRGEIGAGAVGKALENPDRVIAATQLGITLASLGLGWMGEPALSHLLLPLVELFPYNLQSGVSHGLSAAIAFTVIAFLHVVVGQLAPKSIALQNPERTLLLVARPTLVMGTLFKPAIWLLNSAGNLLLRLMGIQAATGHHLIHSVEELKMLVTASAKSGVVEAEESKMLHAVFEFGNLIVRQVMVPRTEMVAVEADTPLPEIISLVTQSSYTKFPVYEDNLDQIMGIVHVKDLLAAMQSEDCRDCTARDFMRTVLYVPETTSVSSLLRQFRDNRLHIAIVMDEFGGNAGLITLEDLLEEIVGEDSDPYEMAGSEIQPQPDGSVMIEGLTLIEEVNEKLGLALHDPDYDTIAGYFLGRLGRIPQVLDSVESDKIFLRVEEMDGLRISRLALVRLGPPSDAPAPSPADIKDNMVGNLLPRANTRPGEG